MRCASYANSVCPNQPAPPHSLIRAFVIHFSIVENIDEQKSFSSDHACLFELEFYSAVNTLKVMSSGSFNLLTLFLGHA